MRKAFVVGLGVALATAATAVAALGQATGGSDEGTQAAEAIYAADCQSCHGPRGEGVAGLGPELGTEGVRGAGPPLTGVAPATVELYLTTGYMPLDDPREQPQRSDPAYAETEIAALVEHVSSFGEGEDEPRPAPRPELGDVAEGQELFADKCAGCHHVVGSGGIALDGVAPELGSATDAEVAAAVRAGPYLMPSFGRQEIDDSELDSLVGYVRYARKPEDPGGWGIGHIGPIAEGFVAWLVAAIGLVAVAMLIGRRMRGG